MNESRNVNGWIFNKLYIRKSDAMQVLSAKKGGFTIEGTRAEILNIISEIEKIKENRDENTTADELGDTTGRS